MEEIADILDKLNDEQIEPVKQTEGAVLVFAGAGSGKTRVLTSRIAYLLSVKKVPPEAVLAITFTNKAADEMKERVEKFADARNMWICTIHSMCVRILRMFPEEAGIQKNFSIYSETERVNVIKKSFQECGYDSESEEILKDAKWHISNAKMLGLTPEEYAIEIDGERNAGAIYKIYSRYQAHLHENNALDFDDLLNETRNLLRDRADVREYLSSRFRYVLVDEFQDTNGVQYEIVKDLVSVHGNLFVVGDDDQSIYGWRGAKIENILHFSKDFPSAKTFNLQRNYRSTKNILNVANAVIEHNLTRHKKTLWTENVEGEPPKGYEAEEESGEARYVARVISDLVERGYRYADCAVLLRLNALTRAFEQEFLSDGIPFKVFGGFKFYERKEVKDLLAYLRVIHNPFDGEALVRIVNFPKRGIGGKTVEALEKYASETGLSSYDALFDLDALDVNAGAKQKLSEFGSQIRGWIKDSLELTVGSLVKKVVSETKMREAYADDSDESINKRANIDEFINSVEEFCKLNEGADLTDFLNQVTLASDTDDMDDGNYVSLATIHSVKGLEFPCVFVSGLEDGVMPVSRAKGNETELEEERRLMYVAVTRAKEFLYLTRSKSRYLYGKREPTLRSQFLNEMSGVVQFPERKNYVRYSGDSDELYDDSFGSSSRERGGYGYARSGERYGGRSDGRITRTEYRKENFSSFGGDAPSSGITFGGAQKLPMQTLNRHVEQNIEKYRVGVKVSHPKFGVGTIVAIKGTSENATLSVAFDGWGIKQLSASLAPLTVLS